METWSTHQLYREAVAIHPAETALSIQVYASKLIASNYPVIFSLAHLAKITHVPYSMLHATVERKREVANYRMFAIRKRSGGLRFIHAVTGDLEKVQKFINREILQKCTPHSAALAFHHAGGIRRCAAQHCGARWLFQFDLSDFFYSVNEIEVFKVFQSMGYREILAFELARLCTTTRLPRPKRDYLLPKAIDHRISYDGGSQCGKWLPYPSTSGLLGVLPQGAPTSPMLSNLVTRKLDESLSRLADDFGLVYTRYADDITLSASHLANRQSVGKIYRTTIGCIRKAGFRENPDKFRIAGPGSKKVVLGLLVDGAEPRISKETYKRIDRHLHASEKYGLENTAAHEGFDSAFGFHNHLKGLIRFVHDVDKTRWREFIGRFEKIEVVWQTS